MKHALAALALAGCSASPAPPPCERSIDGVWRTGARVDGEDVGWHFLDRGATVEGYPTYRDVPADLPAGVQAAPAAIDLVRAQGSLIGGRIVRRFALGSARCTIAAPVHVSRCSGGELTLEIAAIAPPTDWTACGKPGDVATLAGEPIAAPIVLGLRR